ncbi:hypothetical protein BH23GEM9_BH23GEM9_26920 [soil metagenome]
MQGLRGCPASTEFVLKLAALPGLPIESGAVQVQAAGEHPLFDGVRRLMIGGLGGEPTVTEADGLVSVQVDGISAEMRGATVDRAPGTVTIRLPASQ